MRNRDIHSDVDNMRKRGDGEKSDETLSNVVDDNQKSPFRPVMLVNSFDFIVRRRDSFDDEIVKGLNCLASDVIDGRDQNSEKKKVA